MNDKAELRLVGSGGQGVILATVILAEAALLAGKNTAQSQVYGPEARGGSCKAETLISSTPIGFTKVQNPTFLMALTQKSLEQYGPSVDENCLVLIDDTLKAPESMKTRHLVALPILETARTRVGKLQTANIVAVGCINELLGITDNAGIEKAVLMHIPKGTENLNMAALSESLRLVQEYRKEKRA